MLLPVFPLGTAYLPGEDVVLRVFEDRYVSLLKDLDQFNSKFVSVLIAQGSEVGGGDKRFTTGVIVRVDNIALADFGFMVHGTALDRVVIEYWQEDNPYPRAEIVTCDEKVLSQSQCHDAASSLSLIAQNIRTLREMILSRHQQPDSVFTHPLLGSIAAGRWWTHGVTQQEIDRAFWVVASQVPCGPIDRYELLQPDSLLERLSRLRYTVEHVTEIVAFQSQK